ncbi:Rossmann-like and DUF2520 domain-containing protein [Bradyrhizobium sp.]|uniref:Rossmann-like and DUF2520 domain-containing protein n=1 Tax=Bradyrhizobium sp. TaxID=376 RepID=UPI004037B35D
MSSEKFGFIGCGSVGRTLAQAFSRAGHQVVAAWSRGGEGARLMQREVEGLRTPASAQEVADECDFVWLTVSDDAIACVADGIVWRPDHKVVHCSGATDIDALTKAKSAGAGIGGFHPLQMFTDPAVALRGLPGVAVGIEAEGPELLETLKRLAGDIGCTTFGVPRGQRAIYHASVYYVGPFFIALLSEAVAIWKTFGAGEREALNALLPLLAGTTSAVTSSSLAKGMGGCVARGDVGTVRRHLVAMDSFSPRAGKLYRALSERTIPLGLELGSLTTSAADQIREALSAATAADL